METSEKKLGCLQGIKRENVAAKYGYIEGSVNTSLKTGSKEVCLINGKAVFWIANDYDVTVYPEDVASHEVCGVNVFTRKDRTSNDEIFEYTTNLKIQFTNNTEGILKVKTIDLFGIDAMYKTDVKALKECPSGYIPEIAGWLTSDGKKDEHYDDNFCPEGYKPDVVGLRKLKKNYNKGANDNGALLTALGISANLLDNQVEFLGKKVLFVKK